MNYWCESCARKNLCYVVDDRPKCFVPITNTASGTPYLVKTSSISQDSHEIAKTEPSNSEKPNNCEAKNYCDDCLYTDTCDSKEFFYACTSKATISKMEQVDKDINVRSKDEPKTDCNGCKFVGTYDTEFPCANCSRKTKDYYAKDEPQTERSE